MEPRKNIMHKVLFATSVLIIASILIIIGYFLFQNVFEMPLHPALFIIGIIVVILLSVVIAYLLTKLFRALIKSIITFTNNRSLFELVIGGVGAIFALIIAFLLFLSYVLFLQITLVRPLNRLVHSIHSIKAEASSVICVPEYEPVEILDVYTALNAMIRQINALKIEIYEERLVKQNTQMQLFQLQIRPHFFNNALNTLYFL